MIFPSTSRGDNSPSSDNSVRLFLGMFKHLQNPDRAQWQTEKNYITLQSNLRNQWVYWACLQISQLCFTSVLLSAFFCGWDAVISQASPITPDQIDGLLSLWNCKLKKLYQESLLVMVFHHTVRKVMNTEVGTRSGVLLKNLVAAKYSFILWEDVSLWLV